MPLKSLFISNTVLKSIFIVCLFVILAITGMGYKHVQELKDSSNLVANSYKINVELEQIISYLKDAETGQRGFIITNDSTYLEPYLKSRSKINNTLAVLKVLTKNNQDQQVHLKALNESIDERLLNFAKTYAAYIKRDIDAPEFQSLFSEGKQSMDVIRSRVKEMINIADDRLQDRRLSNKDNLSFTPIFLFTLVIVTLVLLIISYAKIQTDISHLKRVNAELEIFKESTKNAEIIAKHGNWIWDIDDDFFEYSDNLFRLLGVEPQSFEPTRENFMRHVHPEDVDKLSEQITKMVEEENLPFISYRIIREDGELRYFKARGQKVSGKDFKRVVIGTTNDITDEVENLLMLEERNFELERNIEELSAFNHVASHDLQEPLRKIQTFLSRLQDKEYDNLSDSGKKYMDRMLSAASRMRLLIDDLLQYSRTNKSDQVFEDVNLNDVLDEAILSFSEEVEEKQAVITHVDLPTVAVIPFQVQQLFVNLIGNSLKYAKTDVAPEISVSYSKVKAIATPFLDAKRSDYYHEITFTDNGIGFDQEYAEKIFELFNRLHDRESYTGTGIGLAICKKIVENHKGYIFAEGDLGKGSVFKIYLPV